MWKCVRLVRNVAMSEGEKLQASCPNAAYYKVLRMKKKRRRKKKK